MQLSAITETMKPGRSSSHNWIAVAIKGKEKWYLEEDEGLRQFNHKYSSSFLAITPDTNARNIFETPEVAKRVSIIEEVRNS